VKDQYFGDAKDYLKYGLLRCFVEAGFDLGVCWMRTPPAGSHGNDVSYLSKPTHWRHHDPVLFDFLSTSITHTRGVDLIASSGLLPGAVFFDAYLGDGLSARADFFSRATVVFRNANLVFFDPDNGIERGTKPGRRDSSRYLYWREVEEVWGRGSSLVIFQIYPREKRTRYIQEVLSRLAKHTPGSHVFGVQTAKVLFAIAVKSMHLQMAALAKERLNAQWQTRMMVVPMEAPSTPSEDHHAINIFWSDEDECYVADIPDLKYCSAFGDTPEEALKEVLMAKELWISATTEHGHLIPPAAYRPA
jgi:predicted RNase H-like HicB family nuclease